MHARATLIDPPATHGPGVDDACHSHPISPHPGAGPHAIRTPAHAAWSMTISPGSALAPSAPWPLPDGTSNSAHSPNIASASDPCARLRVFCSALPNWTASSADCSRYLVSLTSLARLACPHPGQHEGGVRCTRTRHGPSRAAGRRCLVEGPAARLRALSSCVRFVERRSTHAHVETDAAHISRGSPARRTAAITLVASSKRLHCCSRAKEALLRKSDDLRPGLLPVV